LIIGQKYNVIFVIMDRITKWGYFLPYIEEISVEDVIKIYIRELFI